MLQNRYEQQSTTVDKQRNKAVTSSSKYLERFKDYNSQDNKNKEEFIDKYGIELDMPANYIFQTFIYLPDPKYIISSCSQIFPSQLTFYDYDRIGSDQNPANNDFSAQQMKTSNVLAFKTYGLLAGKHQSLNIRTCSKLFNNNFCFSDDRTLMAVFRKEDMPDQKVVNFFKKEVRIVIDIYDTSSIEFFLKTNELNQDDESHIFTIIDKNLPTNKMQEETVLKFSQNKNYLYMIESNSHITIYDLQSEQKEILQHEISERLGATYQLILNFWLDEEDISQSKIAAKKTDFQTIEIFPLELLQRANQLQASQAEASINIFNYAELCEEFDISSFKINEFDHEKVFLRFSRDASTIIYCDQEMNLIVDLKTVEKSQSQKNINHLTGKTCRAVTRYGEKDFLISTANYQDTQIAIRHSSDPSLKIKFSLRFQEGPVIIRDINTFENESIQVVVTRDDEEFIVQKFKSLDSKELEFQHIFYETSNYIFEWPYLCYMRGHQTVIVQNTFSPSKAVYIEMKKMPSESTISHISLTDFCILYLIIETPTEFLIYQRDLSKIQPIIVKSTNERISNEILAHSKVVSTLSMIVNQDNPICRFQKSEIAGVQIYKFHIRGSSEKEVLSTSYEQVIFFAGNNKLFFIDQQNGDKVLQVDLVHKIKMLNQSLYAYIPLDEQYRNTNQIKLLSIGYSDYTISNVYHEVEGKLLEFQVQDNQVICMVRQNSDMSIKIKVLELNGNKTAHLSYQVLIDDNKLASYLQMLTSVANNMFASCNDLYIIVPDQEKSRIIFYRQVIPIDQSSGDAVLFISPIFNQSYRKMIYFVQNKKQQKTKKAIVLPYLNDNYLLYNNRDIYPHFCQFYESVTEKGLSETHIEILNLVPMVQQAFHYSVKGQLQEVVKLHTFYKRFGDTIRAFSQNGEYYLHGFEDENDCNHLTIAKLLIQSSNIWYKKKSIIPISQSQSLEDYQSKSDVHGIGSASVVQEQLQNLVEKCAIESFETNKILVNNEEYIHLKKFYLNEVINYYKQQKCDVKFKINDNQDILIGFTLKESKNMKFKEGTLKELFLLKKEGSNRSVYRVVIQSLDEDVSSNNVQTIHTQEQLMNNITETLLKRRILDQDSDDEIQFSSMSNSLKDCINFTLDDKKIVVYSKTQIFYGDLNQINSNTSTIQLSECPFQVYDQIRSFDKKRAKDPLNYQEADRPRKDNFDEESFIKYITLNGQSREDIEFGNYNIYIKIEVENEYSFIAKYNIFKQKEFASFSCGLNSQIFFNAKRQAYILDDDSITEFGEGIPLYFYKTGVKDVNTKNILGGINKGSRFCKSDVHFMIKDRIYLPYSYFTLVLIQNNRSQTLNQENYNPDSIFCYKGSTGMHLFANDYKNLKFILNQYQRTNPCAINMLLLTDDKGDNVLELALKHQNSRNINLILQKLSLLSINNIHALKEIFPQLLPFNGFEGYLELCFKSTTQMKNKTIFKRKTDSSNDTQYIEAHSTCFLDSQFYENFEDPQSDAAIKPVIIKSLEASWLLKYDSGAKFFQVLSECDNINYFKIDTIIVLINYQWKVLKPLLIQWLFIPFVINMVLFNFYCIYLFEEKSKERSSNDVSIFFEIINWTTQIILLAFTIQTIWVEYKQMQFHKQQYFKSFWNLLDFIVVLLSPSIIIVDFFDSSNSFDHYLRVAMAVCMTIFYVRFFYFLRIFDRTAPLIKTIVQITADIKIFILILFLGIFGFGTTFYILSNNNTDGVTANADGSIPIGPDGLPGIVGQTQFIASYFMALIYSYRMAVGDYGLDSFDTSHNWILLYIMFMFATMFSAVILLNMLVSIMGESFSRVNDQIEPEKERDHLQLIVENDFLFNRKQVFDHVKYLIEIKDDVDQGEEDVIGTQLREFSLQLHDKNKKMKQEFTEMKTLVRFLSTQVSNIDRDMSTIKETLIKISQQ